MCERLLNIAEAAEVLNIPAKTLANYVTAGRVQCRRIGKHVRFSAEDIAAIVAAGFEPAQRIPTRTAVRAARAA